MSTETQPVTPLNTKPVALVVGATQGIGLALTKALLQGKCTHFPSDGIVVGTQRSPTPALVELQNEFPGRLYVENVDLSQDQSIVAFAKNMDEKFGRIDIYIHNSGVLAETVKKYKEPRIDAEEYMKTHLMNVVAPQNCFCSLLPILKKTHVLLGGEITNKRPASLPDDPKKDDQTKVRVLFVSSILSSIELHTGFTGVSIYGSSKTALNMIVKDLSLVAPQFSIDVVHPGYVKTSLAPNGHLTPTESAEGILNAFSQRAYACTAMKELYTWENQSLPW